MTGIVIPVPDLRIGMRIIAAEPGKKERPHVIKTITRCGKTRIHVNERWCYDLCAEATVKP